jgi:hypothetical protein
MNKLIILDKMKYNNYKVNYNNKQLKLKVKK